MKAMTLLKVCSVRDVPEGPVPMLLVADTPNVYVVPLVSPVTTTEVAGGDPVTTVAVWVVVPMKGVTV